jgi:predicted ribosome quality control (RQC) complex YloA/Tae2 family protein
MPYRCRARCHHTLRLRWIVLQARIDEGDSKTSEALKEARRAAEEASARALHLQVAITNAWYAIRAQSDAHSLTTCAAFVHMYQVEIDDAAAETERRASAHADELRQLHEELSSLQARLLRVEAEKAQAERKAAASEASAAALSAAHAQVCLELTLSRLFSGLSRREQAKVLFCMRASAGHSCITPGR